MAALLALAPARAAADAPTPGPATPGASTVPDPTETAFVDALLARMTIAEKVGQLVQGRGGADETGPAAAGTNEAAVRAGAVGSFLGITGAERTCALQRVAVERGRLGIPLLFAYDVVHGLRTIFPMPLAEAASWNLDAIERAARIAAIEATAAGVHWTYAPMVDVTRDPRWGRIVEGAGEDPWLGARIAAARVRGFQGDDAASDDTLLATAKHFVAYGAATGGRDYDMADLSERTLRSVYLPPFEAAVEAGVASVMVAFNAVNGVPAHGNRELLTGVLRDELGFDGSIVSDYDGVRELIVHGVAADAEDAAAIAFDAGVDIDMVSGLYADGLPRALADGRTDAAAIDIAVARVLRMKYRLGLFDDPYRYCDTLRERARTLKPAHRRAARELATESLVLLQNRNDLLPLDLEGRRIALIGPLADAARPMLGGWSMAGRADETVSILEGLRAALPDSATLTHVVGGDVRGDDTSGIPTAVEAARNSDVVVLVVGETPDMSSEANNRTSLDLPGVQDELARAVVRTGTPTVAVLVNGRPLGLEWLDRHAGAVLEAWFPGSEAGHAVADVLTGAVNPSGKLPVTVPRNVGQIPIHYAALRSGRPWTDGQRYVVRYIDSPASPLYPFGHGLSYTSFAYDELRLDTAVLEPGGSIEVSARIANTGARVGTEIVQLYVADPVATIARPVRELRGFERVTLAPGESRRVRFELRAEDLAYPVLAWPERDPVRIAEAGDFTVHVSPSSVGGLTGRFTLSRQWRADSDRGRSASRDAESPARDDASATAPPPAPARTGVP